MMGAGNATAGLAVVLHCYRRVKEWTGATCSQPRWPMALQSQALQESVKGMSIIRDHEDPGGNMKHLSRSSGSELTANERDSGSTVATVASSRRRASSQGPATTKRKCESAAA
ncbi:hypothetical protein VaNZ11_014596 [Volvox africanus]|uniref:Uncharacterized protein n=1 Tax=Volvox africanus TaxID=51714 RepID=A0ABQ5SJN5_9CHLO|nr:hypothetical protein VaNZ11_014596 [Volvox africanus]